MISFLISHRSGVTLHLTPFLCCTGEMTEEKLRPETRALGWSDDLMLTSNLEKTVGVSFVTLSMNFLGCAFVDCSCYSVNFRICTKSLRRRFPNIFLFTNSTRTGACQENFWMFMLCEKWKMKDRKGRYFEKRTNWESWFLKKLEKSSKKACSMHYRFIE